MRIQALIFTGDEAGLYIAGLLKEKKAQGLDVRVIVDAVSNMGPQTHMLVVNDEPAVRACGGGGVQIWEWQGRRAGAAERTEGTIHAKVAVFDRRVSIVGSYNLDPRSRALNNETAIVFENEDLSRQLADLFYGNDLEYSRQITLEDTKAFTDSTDAIYQFQKEFGILIEGAL